GNVAKVYPVPKQHKLKASDFKLVTPNDKSPNAPASETKANSKTLKAAQESESAGGKGSKGAAKRVAAKHRAAAKASGGAARRGGRVGRRREHQRRRRQSPPAAVRVPRPRPEGQQVEPLGPAQQRPRPADAGLQHGPQLPRRHA